MDCREKGKHSSSIHLIYSPFSKHSLKCSSISLIILIFSLYEWKYLWSQKHIYFPFVLSLVSVIKWLPYYNSIVNTFIFYQIDISIQPTEDMSDDFMFPMSARMNSGSGAESDIDLPRPWDDLDVPPFQKRLVRSFTDPSINTHENIPRIPPYPSPPTYKNQRVNFSFLLYFETKVNYNPVLM